MAELTLYNEIGGFGTTAQDFSESLQAVATSEPLTVRLNSPGGDVFDGLAIYNALKSRGGVEIVVDGLAASAASLVAMAGDRIVIHRNAFLMIHRPWGMGIGNSGEMREIADRLDQIGDSMARTYADRSGASVEQAREWMDAETWFDAEAAQQAGLADLVQDNKAAARAFRAEDLALYRNVPRALTEPAAETMPAAAARARRWRLALAERTP